MIVPIAVNLAGASPGISSLRVMAAPKQAMVLAAGRGTRLGALGERRAKALVDIAGEPLLARQLRFLEGQGVERVVVNASHLAEQLEEFAANYAGPIRLDVAVEEEPLGTAGGVIAALDRFSPNPLLVLYGDVLASEDLSPLGELHAAEGAVATLAVYRSDDVAQKGVVELDGSRITGFREKDPTVDSGWVNAGIYVVDPGWLSGRPLEPPPDFGFDLFPEALAQGLELRAHRLERPVLDIGTPEDLERAQRGEG
jgi:NDP-sugar pyrophosphorylase family protein